MNPLLRIQRLFDTSYSDFKLTVTEIDIALATSKGEEKRIAWNDLEEISVYMISYSVVIPCIFWHLKSRTSDLDFPDRAKGSKEALRAIHNLSGFNSLLYSKVFGGHHSEPVVVWKREIK